MNFSVCIIKTQHINMVFRRKLLIHHVASYNLCCIQPKQGPCEVIHPNSLGI